MRRLLELLDRYILEILTVILILSPFYPIFTTKSATIAGYFQEFTRIEFAIALVYAVVFLIQWFRGKSNIFESAVILLLAFIPLYPKFPLIGVPNTWVYIRLEDFIIAFFVGVLFVQTILRKNKIDGALSKPIFFYWLVGGISTILAIIILRGTIAFFPHLTFLHYLRRIEYMVMFFLAFASFRNVSILRRIIVALVLTTSLVLTYALLQKYLNFPIFSTMNEEFAKGQVLYLREGSRIISTFAGHYDLATFLVIVIPIFLAVMYSIKNRLAKIILGIVTVLSFWILALTFSRISFGAYLAAITVVVALQSISTKKKVITLILLLGLSVLVGMNVKGLSDRFSKVARLNETIVDWNIKLFGRNIVPTATSSAELLPISDRLPAPGPVATSSGGISKEGGTKVASESGLVATESGEATPNTSVFIVDRSTGIRFDVEWPVAIKAFLQYPIFGKGYATLSQTKGVFETANDYLRLLGETGILGFITFMSIFAFLATKVAQVLKSNNVKDKTAFAFITGMSGATVGILINATFIDVFEASKVAIVYWLLFGIWAAVIRYYLPKKEK